jgi:hypothetical protein
VWSDEWAGERAFSVLGDESQVVDFWAVDGNQQIAGSD